MSQRSEKYARAMAARMDKLERGLDTMGEEVKRQGRDLTAMEIAMSVSYEIKTGETERARRALKEDQRAARRRQRERERVRALAAVAMAVLLVIVATVALVTAVRQGAAEKSQTAAPAPTSTPVPTVNVLLAEDWLEQQAGPMEPEDVVEAMLAQGYYSLAVPLPFEYQDYMRVYCAKYGCPYPLALAVAERETGGKFNMDAVGPAGEVGIMQLNPGPDGAYHAELEEATGLDPTTPEGNIAGGCYKLGTFLADYGGDTTKALMAYNMGPGGAASAWRRGITSTEYTTAVLEYMEKWECTVNAWQGQ